ncbi:MOSC domain-containing protein [Sulfitobacter donghicola]|uniref:Sulfurase n=1 Tax=Sulfitobacter donghicola DSW-25 = KCTC 12864 = JCM 14565 TaxID=1300350 RepID=A0A073IF87_9RHOB|nr:sulfurase [Sulfitobacter donghicola]KEJ88235.1 sulfurase [Sulfitobacter donghicola DSW-25 = KCTC 12864 = JCM 14565]KIN68829.1 MOSC domain protein [Sulfitobacter donghicola DSW-25 = KCTC 12864 = JCM 14565]
MVERRATDFIATITWMGRMPVDRENTRSVAIPSAMATYAGFEDDFHAGLTRASCSRVKGQHPVGTEIRNTRQLSILSSEELAQIAADIGVDRLDPLLLGASIVVEGIPDFTFVPPGSRLLAENGTSIAIDVENGPCNFPAREIEKDAAGHGAAFKAAARGKRGVTAWVEREGLLSIGTKMRLHIPNQRAWAAEA